MLGRDQDCLLPVEEAGVLWDSVCFLFLLLQRRVFLTESITAESANAILKQLLYLESEDSETPIRLIIDSPGGEVVSGLKIIDQMQGMETPIETCCVGTAASMAAFILAAGEKGRRSILPHSRVMLHEPLVLSSAGETAGSASTIQMIAESIMKTKKELILILARETGRNTKDIERIITSDPFYMDPKEAVSFGICDSVVDRV